MGRGRGRGGGGVFSKGKPTLFQDSFPVLHTWSPFVSFPPQNKRKITVPQSSKQPTS